MNIRRIAWFILLVLLSQQSIAAVRIINSVRSVNNTAYLSVCVDSASHHSHIHHSHSSHSHHSVDHHLSNYDCASTSNGQDNGDFDNSTVVADHHDADGKHCDSCISSAPRPYFSSANLLFVSTHRFLKTEYRSRFIPLAPASAIYRPPISASV